MKIFASGMLKFLGNYLLVGSDKNNQSQHLAVPGLMAVRCLSFTRRRCVAG